MALRQIYSNFWVGLESELPANRPSGSRFLAENSKKLFGYDENELPFEVGGGGNYEEICYQITETSVSAFWTLTTNAGTYQANIDSQGEELNFRVKTITYNGTPYTPPAGQEIFLKKAYFEVNSAEFAADFKSKVEAQFPITLPPVEKILLLTDETNLFPAWDKLVFLDDASATVDYSLMVLEMKAFKLDGTELGGRIAAAGATTLGSLTSIKKGYKFVDLEADTQVIYDLDDNALPTATEIDCPINYNDIVGRPTGFPTSTGVELEGYTESGTRAGADLIVGVGDHDSSNNGNRISIDDGNEEFTLYGSDKIGISPQGSINQAVFVQKSGSSLELKLTDASTANAILTFGDGAGTATLRTLGNISLNQDISGSIFRIRTENAAGSLLERLFVTGRVDVSVAAIMNSNVGINENTPERRLHVKDNAKPALFENDNSISPTFEVVEVRTAAAGSYLYFVDTNTTYINGVQIGSRGDEFAIHTQGIERVRVDEDGNVGIGTNLPDDKLHVNGGNIKLQGTGTVPSAFALIRFYDNINALHGNIGFSGIRFQMINDIASPIQIGDANNNVGIGTPFPNEKLDVAGDARFGDANSADLYNDSVTGFINLRGGTETAIRLHSENHPTWVGAMDFRTSNIQRAIILNSGEFGINTTTPEERLHVNGVIRQETPNDDASINWGIADYHDGTNIANIYYHIKLPYFFQTSPPYNANGGQNHWHLHVTGSSNGADTAIDLRFMGFLFSPNNIFNNSETIAHNNPAAGKGVLGVGSYISPTDNAVVCWFQLEGSNQTRFRVDSMRAGTSGNILSEGEVTIIQSTNAQI